MSRHRFAGWSAGGLVTAAGLRAVGAFVAAVGVAVGGCARDADAPLSPPPQAVPALRPADGLLNSPPLQRVVELQIRRDGPALQELLGDPNAAVRARAAFALGSVQWAESQVALEELLRDPEPQVRRDAAFALGHLDLADGGRALAEALLREEDSGARGWMMEAVGRAGNASAVATLLLLDPGDQELALTRGLTRALLRDVTPEGGLAALVGRLSHPDPEVREAAAYFFGRAPDTRIWDEHAAAVRDALDAYTPREAAAMHLSLGLARLQQGADRERLLRWLRDGGDWRIRVNVARGLGAQPWLEREGVREALFRALDDASEHVAATAARALTQGFWVPPDVLARMDALIREDADRWRVHAPFLSQLANFHDAESVIGWTRRMVGVHPAAVSHGLAALSGVHGSRTTELILEVAGHADPEIRASGIAALAQGWQTLVQMGVTEERIYRLLVSEIWDGSRRGAIRAAQPLTHPVFLELGALEELHGAFHRRVEAGDFHVAKVFRDQVAAFGDVSSMALPYEETPAVDWGFLATLGPDPRLVIETEEGKVVLRLAPDQAPLTVQVLASQAMAGLHDGVPFHRVEPNFVAQGGDVGAGDGAGGPGYVIGSEFSQLLFRRGVVGMASAGKDTEGSQFFVTHSTQLHLDGEMTAFGWVESGLEVLDRIYQGDRVLRMRVEPGGGD